MNKIAFALSFWVLVSAVATGDLITFDDLGVEGAPIPDDYGDTPEFDVSYLERSGFGDASQVKPSLSLWRFDFGNLVNVAYGDFSDEPGLDGGDPSLVAEITLTASSGEVMLESFDLAGYQGDRVGRSVRIYDGDFNQLWSEDGVTIVGDTGVPGSHSSFTPAVSAPTLRLQWDYPARVAADNIRFSAVPEPSPVFGLALIVLACVGIRTACVNSFYSTIIPLRLPSLSSGSSVPLCLTPAETIASRDPGEKP